MDGISITAWPAAGDDGDVPGKRNVARSTDMEKTRGFCSCPRQRSPERSEPSPTRSLLPRPQVDTALSPVNLPAVLKDCPDFSAKFTR